MFSSKFDNITPNSPGQAKAVRLVARFFDEKERAQKQLDKIKLDPQRLQEITDSLSATDLAQVIALLVSENILKRIVVVTSPLGGGIAEFSSISEVPETLLDNRQDQYIEVTPERIKTFYTPIL